MQGRHARERVAVIGSGVAGLTAAYVCSAQASVTLFEAADRLGGHADTHLVEEDGRELAIDTGFIVHNLRTYPVLTRLFDELGVSGQDAEMSMSISDATTGLEWAGARGIGGLLPTLRNPHLADHLRMLAEIPVFHRRARRLLALSADPQVGASRMTEATEMTEPADMTLREFLAAGSFSAYFVRHYMEPLVAAVWSCDPTLAGEYPACYLFEFLQHHGMLSVLGSPSWRTVRGGSGTYVAAVAAALTARGGEVRTSTPVAAVEEDLAAADAGVLVTDAAGNTERFDRVVIAVHPHQALAMLPAATPAHKEVLGAIEYSPNTAVLHTDASLLPRSERTWSSWNFRRDRDAAGPVVVTYDLTRLQRLDTAVRYLVTLGGEDLIDPATVLARMDYEHPLYTPRSVAAQRRLPELNTDRVAFAGAYHGWGFHEDGARSGLAAARRLGHDWAAAADLPDRPSPHRRAARPVVYDTTVEHVRHRPWRRRFRHRSSLWLVELGAAEPAARGRGSFAGRVEARDHLGDPALPIRDNLAAFLASQGVELGDARVRLAAHPRALGFCFNPISVFWCHRRDGSPLATVVEVHNTYGDRHAYLLPPGPGPHVVPKQMYVSPFNTVSGHYLVDAPEPGEDLEVSVGLIDQDGPLLGASLRGCRTRRPSWTAGIAGLRDALRIRAHGIVLWGRGLAIQPRPAHHQEGVR